MVVDDDRVQCTLLQRWLTLGGWDVDIFPDGESCLLALASQAPAAICLDLHLPGLSGLETLKQILRTYPDIPVIMLTADGAVENAVNALKTGAFDYLTKPPDRDKLLKTIENAVEHGLMTLRMRTLENESSATSHRGMLGESPQIKALFREMDAVALLDVTVLIHGESGTGKELIASGLHSASKRSNGPLITLNCAAIPESLQESELFGHERGAFTGASTTRQGRFELANGGTLFLDEVGDLSPAAQAKLLRVLETRTFQRVGGHRDLKSDFRLIAATHRDLKQDVESGRFREDLYYRLAVFEIEVPPLRHRGADALLLAREFAAKHGERLRGRRAMLDAKSIELVRSYDWPGNVRELDNAIQRAVVSCHGGVIKPSDFPERIQSSLEAGTISVNTIDYTPESVVTVAQPRMKAATEKMGTLEEFERHAISGALQRTGNNAAAASRLLGIGRTTLYAKMKKYGLEKNASLSHREAPATIGAPETPDKTGY